jgi:hypothetical protein
MPTPAEIEKQKRAWLESRMSEPEKTESALTRYISGNADRADSLRAEKAYPDLRPGKTKEPRTLNSLERSIARVGTQGYLPDDPQRNLGLTWRGSPQATADSTAAGLKKEPVRPSNALADSIASREMKVLQGGGLSALRESRRTPSASATPKNESLTEAAGRFADKKSSAEKNIKSYTTTVLDDKKDPGNITIDAYEQEAKAYADSLGDVQNARALGFTDWNQYNQEKAAITRTFDSVMQTYKTQGKAAAESLLADISGGNMTPDDLARLYRAFTGRIKAD